MIVGGSAANSSPRVNRFIVEVTAQDRNACRIGCVDDDGQATTCHGTGNKCVLGL